MLSRPQGDSWLRPITNAFRPDIAGLRAVAVIAVVVYHLNPQWLPGGFAGVDIFFVLSGFLITGILWREYLTRGKIRLMEFYARRARRLIPAALFLILAVLVASALVLPFWLMDDVFWQGSSASVYAANIWFALQGADYFTESLELPQPFLHMWTLGVEEQFYFVLPILLVVALAIFARGDRSPKVVAIAVTSVVTFVSLGLSVALTPIFAGTSFYLLHTRLWEFGVGAVAAIVMTNSVSAQQSTVFKGGTVLALAGLAGITASFIMLDDTVAYPSFYAALPVLSTLALLIAHPSVSINRTLGMKPFVAVGNISYSWYLWHYPPIILLAAAGVTMDFPALLLAAGIGLLGALVSYFAIEKPFRFGSFWFTRLPASRVVAVTLLACLFVGSGSAVAAVGVMRHKVLVAGEQAIIPAVEMPVSSREESRPPQPSAQRVESDTAQPGALEETVPAVHTLEGKTVVLVGDSHSLHWEDAFAQAVSELGGTLVMHSLLSCPAIDVYVTKLDGSAMREGCREHRSEFWQVAESADIVVLSQAEHYIDRLRGPDGQRLSESEREVLWSQAYRAWLEQASELDAVIGVVADNPKMPGNPATCVLYSTDPSECDASRAKVDEIMGALPSLSHKARAAGLPNTDNVLPVFEWICDDNVCRASDVDGAIFADNQHLATEWALEKVPAVQQYLLTLLNQKADSF